MKARTEAVKPSETRISSGASVARVVVKFRDETAVRLRSGRLVAAQDRTGVSQADQLVQRNPDLSWQRLFAGQTESQLDRSREVLQQRSRHALADLNSYFEIPMTSPRRAEALINQLNALPSVEIAYFEPAPEPAGDIYPPTPDYQSYQDYREAAPAGVDADYANTLPGGDGSGVKIIDIELDWRTTHEDLDKALGAVIGSYPGGGSSYSNHGTAVIGELIAGNNEYGVTGICPGADIGMVSVLYQSTASAIYTGIENLEPGDVMLIELHAPGPRYNFQDRPDQLGYVCMEYWQANYDAMLYAWARGIIVVEAAGNGAEDLDDVIYENLFDTTYRNSHAIIVGAGYPAASGDNLKRLGFSNYGSRVNLQGYGSGVYTCGYGTLFNGDGDVNQYYTATFSGTSSASPIVTGAVTCLQGYYRVTYGVVLTSDMARDALVSTGTPQAGDTSEHIGPRPDLAGAVANLSEPPDLYVLPILIDTNAAGGTILNVPVWLHNRSNSGSLDFSISDSDSLVKLATDWLSATPAAGTIGPVDSAQVEVSLDATLLAPAVATYRGAVYVNWGPQGEALEQSTTVPVYFSVPCNDTTYQAESSNDAGEPVYNWISARTLGWKIPWSQFYAGGSSNKLDDGSVGPRNIGFKFPFFDTTYNRLYMGVNGAISFTDSSLNVDGYYAGLDVPGAPFRTLVAPFWNDLIFDSTQTPLAGIYMYNDPSYDTLVIEWYHPGSFNTPEDTSVDFEVILSVDGSIVFQYANVGVSGLQQTCLVALAGVGCQGLSYVNAGDIPEHVVSPAEAVRFSYADRDWVQAGDVDTSGAIDIADLVYLVQYMFAQGPEPIPLASANVNCVGGVDISDLVFLVTYMFQSGPEPCYYLREL